MAQDPGFDSGGGGTITLGGTATSMCAISPTDTVSTFNNLMARIDKLEQIVSQITGANIHASTLGDLASQVGWVYGVTYMGIPGWTQTEYGTLIPPAGFSLSDIGFTLPNACTGEEVPYQGVVMDSEGVLQFGFTPTGTLCGSKVEDWNDAYDRSLEASSMAFASADGEEGSVSQGLTVLSNDLGDQLGGASIQVDRHAYYLVEASGMASSGSFPATDFSYSLSVAGVGGTSGQDIWGTVNLFMSRIVELAAGATVTVTYSIDAGSLTESVGTKSFHVMRVLDIE